MTLSLCLFGLILCNYVDGKPFDQFRHESRIQDYKDIIKNNTETKRNEEVSIEINEYCKNITLAFVTNTTSLEDSIDYIEPKNVLTGLILYLDDDLNIASISDYNVKITELKDCTAEEDKVWNETGIKMNDQAIVNDKHDDKFPNAVTEANKDQTNANDDKNIDVLNENCSAEGMENIDPNGNESSKLTIADEYEIMLSSIVESDVMGELEDKEKVERNSRAVGSDILQSYVLASTNGYSNYNYIGHFGNIDQNNQLCNRIAVKQSLPVKSRVKISRTFTDHNWKMTPAFTYNGNIEKAHYDNIATDSEPRRYTGYSPGSLDSPAHTGFGSAVDKTFHGKLPVSGKFTVAANFS